MFLMVLKMVESPPPKKNLAQELVNGFSSKTQFIKMQKLLEKENKTWTDLSADWIY